ncbi:hypothetical protein RDI58_024310 [Solanum bulbocastanum]|uniref:Uncharacterized protein n=1 Tax=Solanum bulbocastanum TaxID=147425 RepID=A0AAN8T1K8_SOLBU
MFVLTKHNAMALNIDPKCAAFCVLRFPKKPICLCLCLVKYAITTITYESVDTEAANVFVTLDVLLVIASSFSSTMVPFLRTDMQKVTI